MLSVSYRVTYSVLVAAGGDASGSGPGEATEFDFAGNLVCVHCDSIWLRVATIPTLMIDL